jgi:iron complex outermembrane receptor protein
MRAGILQFRISVRGLRVAIASTAILGSVWAPVTGAPQGPGDQEVLPPPAAAMDSVQPPGQAPAEPSPVAELENLLQSAVEVPALAQEVTTVSGQQSTVGKSPAAVFVITQEMIRRSGATSIPEVLRMAPGVQVARIDSSQWAITARGFNTNIAGIFATNNKLLILIDGRTVYTRFFNGTYWDVQDLMLEDVERIEVIRGPGATIWGSNAVNGVINIITKRAADTQGGLVTTGGGSEERGFANARVGGGAGDVHYRVYGKWFERDASFHSTQPQTDDWRQGRGGGRIDWTPNDCDLLTLQGDAYHGTNGFLNTAPNPDVPDDERVVGGNVIARWTRTFSDESDVALQLYYDRADRENNIGFVDQQFDTYDIDFRHHFPLGTRHNIIWGVGYRAVHDRLESLTAPPGTVLGFDPVERTYDTFSTFAQDEMALTEELLVTFGAKLQHHDFSDWELQPTIRLLYSPEETWAAWAAVSRAVRTPSRIEHDGVIAAGAVPFLDFVPTFDSEELIAYEIGYRSQPEPWFSWDLALFFNQYADLSSLRATPPGVLPIVNFNGNTGEGYGVELAAQLDVTEDWRLSGNYSFLQLQIHPGAGTLDFLGAAGSSVEGSSPHNQVFVTSSHDLTDTIELDLISRYVDTLPFHNVPSYIELDVRLAWHPNSCTELAVVGQNLLDPHHPEFGGGHEIERGVYGTCTIRW